MEFYVNRFKLALLVLHYRNYFTVMEKLYVNELCHMLIKLC